MGYRYRHRKDPSSIKGLKATLALHLASFKVDHGKLQIFNETVIANLINVKDVNECVREFDFDN